MKPDREGSMQNEFDLIIQGGLAVSSKGISRLDIGVRKGVIAKLLA